MKIKPLTHKMKNRVREHGEDWYVVSVGAMSTDLLISPVPHRLKSEPYMIWITKGKDLEIL